MREDPKLVDRSMTYGECRAKRFLEYNTADLKFQQGYFRKSNNAQVSREIATNSAYATINDDTT